MLQVIESKRHYKKTFSVYDDKKKVEILTGFPDEITAKFAMIGVCHCAEHLTKILVEFLENYEKN